MKILVTGSKGFVGSELVKHLLGHQIYTIDKSAGQDLLTCDLNYEVDAVIHLAASSGIRPSLVDPDAYWRNNVLATKRLFEHFKNTKILYASSSTAKEPDRNPYALSKYTVERMAPEGSIGLRFCTIYNDSQQRPNMFIPRLFRKDISFINTNHKRDFIHISDVCEAIKFLLTQQVSGVFDIGTGISTPLKEITDFFNIKVEERTGDEHERLDNIADISKLRDLGWEPKVKLFEYLKQKRDLTFPQNLNIINN